MSRTTRPSLYYVEGSTGEYSDHQEWPVAVYYSEAKAQEHAEKADARAREIQVSRPSEFDVPEGMTNEFDANMQMDYTGTHYNVYPVPLMDEPGAGS